MAALKARYLPYRLMLRYYLWMSRFGRQRQWMLVIGFWVAYQILNAVRASHPEMGPYIWPGVDRVCGVCGCWRAGCWIRCLI